VLGFSGLTGYRGQKSETDIVRRQRRSADPCDKRPLFRKNRVEKSPDDPRGWKDQSGKEPEGKIVSKYRVSAKKATRRRTRKSLPGVLVAKASTSTKWRRKREPRKIESRP